MIRASNKTLKTHKKYIEIQSYQKGKRKIKCNGFRHHKMKIKLFNVILKIDKK